MTNPPTMIYLALRHQLGVALRTNPIADMWRQNPLWGSERIRRELEKLGMLVSNRSIRRYRWRPGPRPAASADFP